MNISPAHKHEYPEIVEVWEASVRATHDFLLEEDIQFFKPLILNEYLAAVDLHCAKDATRKIVGFVGVADKKIEMLFLHPDYLGKGIGKLLLNFAVNDLRATKVDVNEQNPQAVGFYQHLGFKVIHRSPVDGLGKPYPILHLKLQPE
jgi:putative acetyltransferase